MEENIKPIQENNGESESPWKILLLIISFEYVFFSWINQWLVCHLSILYFRNIIITGDIFKMFTAFRIQLSGILLRVFFLVNPDHTLIFLVVLIIHHDHLVYDLLIFAATRFFFFFITPFVLKGKHPYIQWIWLFSPLESMLSFYVMERHTIDR